MKEFVYGSDYQYNLLKQSLNDHLCHVYPNCTLPQGCSKGSARIGFEKENDTYALFIDKGITYSGNIANSDFYDWLNMGTLRFLDFTDLKEFLLSLKVLY